MHLQNLVKIHFFVLKIWKLISDVIQGQQLCNKWRKWMLNNHMVDIVNIIAPAKFTENPLLRSQDIEQKLILDIIQGP